VTFPRRLPRFSLPFSTLLLISAACGAYAQQTTAGPVSAGEDRQALEDLRPGTLGNIHWDREKKSATIRVMDSTGYRTDLTAMLKDMQVTVVHELVHLELASLPVAEADRNNQEFAIDRLTAALLAAEEGRSLSEYLSVANPPAPSRPEAGLLP